MRKIPPPAIGSERVLAYAFIDKTIRFTGKQRLFVNGELLGPVSNIAIAKSLSKAVPGYFVLFCDRGWNIHGIVGESTFGKALKEAERCYQGVTSKFVKTSYTEKAARAWISENYPSATCSFCRRLYFEVDSMIESENASICSTCIKDFAKDL